MACSTRDGRPVWRALFLALLLTPLPATSTDDPASSAEDGLVRPVIRILPPLGTLEGKATLEVLVIDREVARLRAFVGDVEIGARNKPPWNIKVDLPSPAAEQTIRVLAETAGKRDLGEDTVVINRVTRPLRVRIAAIDGDPAGDGVVTVRADVSVPRAASLRVVRFFYNDQRVTHRTEPPFEAEVPMPSPRPEDVVRVVAELEDGRVVEDAQVVAARGEVDEVDVNLVQLQTLVTTKRGMVITDLEGDDFEIRQRGTPQALDRFYLARDLPLVLGLVVDTSGSMGEVWQLTMDALRRFLASAVDVRDRAFLIDFAESLRLAQPLTHDMGAIEAALQDVRPEGGTSLFDAMLYGLLQYTDQPGRRALVVITDGVDSTSTSDSDRVLELAERLGVPIYVVSLPFAGGRGGMGMQREATNLVHTLKLFTDPTGGRLIRVGRSAGLARAFGQIASELRSQYVLTYYTEALPERGVRDIDVRVKDRKDLQVRAVLPLDQAQ